MEETRMLSTEEGIFLDIVGESSVKDTAEHIMRRLDGQTAWRYDRTNNPDLPT